MAIRWYAAHMKLTLELDIGREGCKVRGAERPLIGNMVIGQMAYCGK